MRKLYLLLDEWKNDRNFVGSELEEIKKYFDVTVICNDFDEKNSIQFPNGVKFFFYNRKNTSGKIKAIFHVLFDRLTWDEIRRTKSESNRVSKISEIVRFYINAELFYEYLKHNRLFEDDSEAIYYSYWYFWKCFAIARHKMNAPNVRIITRVHGYDLYKDQIPTNWQPFKQLMDSLIDRIVFISEHGMDYYFREYGIKKSDKHVLYKLGTYNKYGLNPNNELDGIIRIVSCSSVIELKRVHLIVEALEMISDTYVEWIHYGDGPLLDDIKTLANDRLGKKTNISFMLPGYVNNSDILKYYSANHVDMFVMTSRSEGNPISVIEAMSFGIPIIATNINNMSNLVDGNGLLISSNPNPEELFNAIMRICNFNRAKMRIMSRAIWEEEFQATNNNAKFVQEVLLKL